jgi:Domain of unknown function (DUF4326)
MARVQASGGARGSFTRWRVEEMKPKRIQLRRTKDWKKPAGAIVCARPSKWGNPFRVFGENEYLYCDVSHRRTILTPWVIFDQDQDIVRNPATPEMAVAHYRNWLTGMYNAAGIVRPCPHDLVTEIRRELRDRDLCCWCKIGTPCHVSVLLEIANR